MVCNACVSGLSAIILAERLLRCGFYDYAVVCGAEVQSRFIVSGFQSLKAMSAQPSTTNWRRWRWSGRA